MRCCIYLSYFKGDNVAGYKIVTTKNFRLIHVSTLQMSPIKKVVS